MDRVIAGLFLLFITGLIIFGLVKIIEVYDTSTSHLEKSSNSYKLNELAKDCKLLLPICLIGEQNRASDNCKSYIQEEIKYDYEWVDGLLEPKFSHYRILKPFNFIEKERLNNFKDSARENKYSNNEIKKYIAKKQNRIVTYIGDRLKIQTKYGAWNSVVYECDYQNEIGVLDVRILDRKSIY